MLLNELITTLQAWQQDPRVAKTPPMQQFVDSDFGILAVTGTDLSIDVNNDGTLPDVKQGAPE